METPAAPGKGKGPIIDPALCRCCRNIKKCRLLTIEYEWNAKKEIYSEMFMDCFGLLLSNLDGDKKDCCVCATCVVRLRDACAFRQQVLQCEDAFLSFKLQSKEGEDAASKMADDVKDELSGDESDDVMNDDGVHHDYDDEDDIKLSDMKDNKLDIKSEDKVFVRKRPKGKVRKKQILHKMNKLKAKLDDLLDKPIHIPKVPDMQDNKLDVKSDETIGDPLVMELLPKRKLRSFKKSAIKKEAAKISDKKEPALDKDSMMYHNAVTIVHYSYVCPFSVRISIYYCFYCRDQFTNPNELREHTLTHDPIELFTNTIENHKKIPKIDITRIDCRLCSDKIDDLESFKRHISSAHQKVIHPVAHEFLKFKLTMDNLVCTECDSVFPYFDVLKKHMIVHFGTYICDICGACFLEQNSLRTHITKHTKVEQSFPCQICGKNLKSKYSRYLHIATIHEKKPTVNCYKCEASFLSYALRNRHLIEVHGDTRTFPCKMCDKVYTRRKTLMEHIRRSHLKVYRHQCDLCDQRFYLPSRLKEHMATHTGERNYRCEYCDKSYPRLQSLQEHIRSHSNEKRYKCEVCNSTFTQNGSLKIHMKSQHGAYDIASFS